MNQAFLSQFLSAALQITNAERGMAVDTDLTVLEMHNLDEKMVQMPEFGDLAFQALGDAISQRETILTNNVITDPAQAPITNTNFSELRVVVAIPVLGVGAIYLDQHIRNGIIPRENIEKLQEVATRVVTANRLEMTHEEIVALFNQI